MIVGEYPCCDGVLSIQIPGDTPCYAEEDCPHCGVKVWHKLSRIDPKSWVEADFLAGHDVDYEAGNVKEKGERDATV